MSTTGRTATFPEEVPVPKLETVRELHFVLSDRVAKEAATAFAAHERRIRSRLPNVEVRHTGGTSVPGVLTTGDVDLQVRTNRRSFAAARDALCELHEPPYPDDWHDDSAYFTAADANPPVEGCLHRDRHP